MLIIMLTWFTSSAAASSKEKHIVPITHSVYYSFSSGRGLCSNVLCALKLSHLYIIYKLLEIDSCISCFLGFVAAAIRGPGHHEDVWESQNQCEFTHLSHQ